MTPQWPARRIAGYLVALAVIAVGVWLLSNAVGGPSSPPGQTISLTGLDRSGRLEVPVINMWKEPGFSRSNQVVARIQLPRSGKVEAVLLNRRQAGALTWNEISFRDVHGWVVNRFVAAP